MLASTIARQLSDEFAFIFACLDEEGLLADQVRGDGFEVFHLGRRVGLDACCARQLAHIARRERVSIFHAHQYTPFFYSLASGFFGRRPPVVFTEHGRHFPDYPRQKRMMFNRLCLRQRDRVVAVGNGVRQAVIRNEGIAARRVEVIHNGVRLPNGAPRSDRIAVRNKIGLAPDDYVAIVVARFDPVKDLITAIRVTDAVIKSVPNARLVLVGDGPERDAVEGEIRARQLQPHVRLLGFRRDVPELLAAADVCLLTSLSEGIPLSLIEAMSEGLPVVATRVGGVPEVVIDGQTGILTRAQDVGAMAAAITKLAQDRPLSESLGEYGNRRARECFSQDRMCDKYRTLFREMANLP